MVKQVATKIQQQQRQKVKMNKSFLTTLFLFFYFGVFAQLEIFPIWQESDNQRHKARTSAVNDTLQLPFIENFVQLNSQERWTKNNGVYINNHFAFNQPSIGVSTLDGVDASGKPYVFRTSASQAQGIGDYIESKIVDLSTISATDGLAFNFFWQQGTLFDFNRNPTWEDGERLRLYFKDSTNSYKLVWPTPTIVNRIIATGITEDTFYLENILVEPKYFHKGFQFKFEYYGILTGNYAVFNVDNIWMDKGIAKFGTETTFAEPKDYAFSKTPETILEKYSSVPINHFLASDESIIQDTISAKMYSLDTLFIQDTDSSLYITHQEKGTVLASYGSSVFDFTDLKKGIPTEIKWPIDKKALKDNLDASLENQSTSIQTRVSLLTPDSVRVTDSTSSYTHFSDYYAYDDGTIEAGLGVRGVGEFVQEFSFIKDDVINGFYVYFPKYGLNLENTFITYKVYGDLKNVNGATSDQELIAQNGVVEYSTDSISLNKFVLIPLSEPINVVAGKKYYFGISQNTENKVLLGLDYSNDQSTNIYYRLFDNPWETFASSDGTGCVAIRPIAASQNIGLTNQETNKTLAIFPNPSHEKVYLEAKASKILVYNLAGKLEMEFEDTDTFDVKKLEKGAYLVQCLINNEQYSQKLFVD
jgi:hypothetical protein